MAGRLVIATPSGDAWADLDVAEDATKLLVIGHGAGGSVGSADLLAVTQRCVQAGISVARVTQPYRVAGKRAPPNAVTLDAAWQAVIRALGDRKSLAEQSFIYAGRSSGARVACRCAADGTLRPRPIGVVALAFPVHPPGKPEVLRTGELDSVSVPVLVVQGDRDPFGMPGRRRGRKIVVVPGDHSLKQAAPQVGDTVARWLSTLT
jgi:predicted alpha/beta-hydrolase family hydrolase